MTCNGLRFAVGSIARLSLDPSMLVVHYGKRFVSRQSGFLEPECGKVKYAEPPAIRVTRMQALDNVCRKGGGRAPDGISE